MNPAPSNASKKTAPVAALIGTIKDALSEARLRRHRHCLVVAGTPDWVRQQTDHLLGALNADRVVWFGGQKPTFESVIWCQDREARTLLGQEANILVVDCFDGLDPNGIGATSGMVSGGGLIIFMRSQWGEHPTGPGLARRLVDGGDAVEHVTHRYTKRFWSTVEASDSVDIWDEILGCVVSRQMESSHDTRSGGQGGAARTVDQAQAIELIEKVARGRKRRPLVLNSDRGRGKTAALGIAAGRLLSQAPQNILVVTPTLSAVSPLLEQAARFWPDSEAYNSGLRGDDRHLRVIRPSELSQTLPDAHLVLVDEAAALPVPLLVRLLVNYPRVVFSTTIHGYEGTGQGFALRFQQHLDRETPHWHQFVLSEPIRWAPYDPVERLVLEALCLKTELSVIPHVDSHGDDIHIRLLNRDELEANETLLNQVFTLLIDAHYRTSPLDLARLLDAPNMRIWVASQGEMITGVSLVAEEGGLSQAMAEHVSIGERRLKGHLLPQTMCAHMGFIPAATQIAWRIVRIAVAKSHRRQGIGGRLMDAVETEAKAVQVDYLGAAFGAMVALLKFWESKDFSLMRIGARRGPANGLHAAVVAKTVSRGSMRWFSEARSRFERSFSRQLTGPLRSLEVETVSHGIRSVFTLTPSPKLTTHEWSELHAFSRGGRPFEAVYDLLWVFTHFRLQVEDSLPYAHVSTRDVLVRSVLQGWEWSGLTACSGVSGRGDAVGLIAADVASNLDSIRARIEL